MFIVIDVEYYHNKKREVLGPIKQLGAFKFDENYRVVDIFEMTVTKYTTQAMLKMLFTNFIKDVNTLYVWAKNNDMKALNEVLNIDENSFEVVDVQNYFKDVNLASLSTVSEALLFEPEGRHNALVDAEYTLEVIKHFDLNNEVSRKAISNYINLIRNSEVSSVAKNKGYNKPQKEQSKKDYKIISPGNMRKLNEDYYQITNERAIAQLIDSIVANKLPIGKDGSFELEPRLETLCASKSKIVFSNTERFKSIAKKFNDKLIIIVDANNNYLGAFVSRKAYKDFIK